MFILVWGPVGAVYRLRLAALPAFLSAMLVMGLGLGIDKTPGAQSAPAYIAAVVSCFCLALNFIIWIYWVMIWDLETIFRGNPWKTKQEKAGNGGICPFTGLKPEYTCRSCGTMVHGDYWHSRDFEMSFPVGDDVADWAKVQNVIHNADPKNIKQARVETDEAIQFRSNYIWIAITECCKGCEEWKKSFNLAPRHALSLTFVGWFGSFCVWGFGQALSDTGSVAPQIITYTFGIFYSILGLFMMLRGVGSSIAFLEVHRKQLEIEHLYTPTKSAFLRFLATRCGPWSHLVSPTAP